VRRYVLGKDT